MGYGRVLSDTSSISVPQQPVTEVGGSLITGNSTDNTSIKAFQQILSSNPHSLDASTMTPLITLAKTSGANVAAPPLPDNIRQKFESTTKDPPVVEDVLTGLQGMLKELINLGGKVGAMMNSLVDELGLRSFLESGMDLGLDNVIKLFKSAGQIIEKNSALKTFCELSGLKSIVDGVSQLESNPAGGLFSLVLGSVDFWQNVAMVAGLVAFCVGTGGAGIGLVAAGFGARVICKKALSTGGKELLEKIVKESVEKLGSTEVKDEVIKDIFGSTHDLIGKSVKEVGEAIARRNADLVNDLVIKVGGYDKITEQVLKDIKEKCAKALKQDYERLFKGIELDKLAEEGASQWLKSSPDAKLLLKNAYQGSKQEKQLVGMITKEYLDQMGSLKTGWFQAFEGRLTQLGGEAGAKLAGNLKDDFLKAVDDAARPLLEKGIQRAVRRARDEGRDHTPTVIRASVSEVGQRGPQEEYKKLTFKGFQWSEQGQPVKNVGMGSKTPGGSTNWVAQYLLEQQRKTKEA